MRDGNAIATERHWEDKHRPEQRFFRCPLPIENSAATLRFSGTMVPVELQESSIDGFAVLVQQKHVSKLRLGPRWVLQSANQRSEVWPQWLYCAPDGHVQVGLRRLQDLTPGGKPRWWQSQRARYRQRAFLLGALAVLIAVAVSLPGLGELPSLSELPSRAPWIEQALRDLLAALQRLQQGT